MALNSLLQVSKYEVSFNFSAGVKFAPKALMTVSQGILESCTHKPYISFALVMELKSYIVLEGVYKFIIEVARR